MMGRQLALDLNREPSYAADAFLTSGSNADAFAMIEAWPDWPGRMLVLLGPAGSGKSHLAAIWAAQSGATIVRPGAPLDPDKILDAADPRRQAVLLEDCDRSGHLEPALFHLINLVQERQGWLLVTARNQPDTWDLRTPDLISRLRQAPAVSIDSPNAALISAVLVKLFDDRQIRIDPDVIAYAALHGDQTLDAVRRFVAIVDAEALAEGRRITRPLAMRALARLNDSEAAPQ